MLNPASPGNAPEARQSLLQIAGRRTLPIPPELVVGHVIGLAGPWDWPVRRAALEAILRRLASVRAQEIRSSTRLWRGPWGRYRLARADVDEALAYDVRLWSLSPLRGACDCADFTRGELGICKHVAAIVTHLARRPRLFARCAATPPASLPRLVWDPTVSKAGPTDVLTALQLSTPGAGGRGHAGWARIAKIFRTVEGGVRRLRATHPDDPLSRLRLVEALRSGLTPAAAQDPAARAVLSEEHARLTRTLRLRSALGAKRPTTARRRLYAYQKEGVRRFLAQGRLLLADDMGLGKTTQAVVAATALHDAGLVGRGLLVVPAALKPQWDREWSAISPAPLRLIDGDASERRAIYASTRQGFLVTNYEQVIKDLDAISAWSPELVILDEAQRIKNWATKTAQAIKRLAPAYRLVLTGTPMENRLEELASIVEWVDDRALEPKWRLAPWHSAHGDGRREVVGARNLGELRARLAPVLLRRTRAEVLGQLPPRQDTTIPVDPTDRQQDAHDELNQPIAKLARVAQRRPLTPAEFLRLMSLLATQRMIANGLALQEFTATWPAIRGTSTDRDRHRVSRRAQAGRAARAGDEPGLTQGRKVVVFSQWRRMLELGAWVVADLLEAPASGRCSSPVRRAPGAGRRTSSTSTTIPTPRSSSDGCGRRGAQPPAGRQRLHQPRAALEPRGARAADRRIHRLGQERPIDVFNLMTRRLIEERIAGLVADKRALFKGLFEGTTEELRFDGGSAIMAVLDRLTEEVRAEVEGAADDEPEERLDGVGADGVGAGEGLDGPRAAGGMPAAEPAPDGGAAPMAASGPSDGDGGVARLFDAVTINRRNDGGVVIEAPPETARALVSLFEGMSRLMAAATPGRG